MTEQTSGAQGSAADSATPEKGLTDYNDQINALKKAGVTPDQILAILTAEVSKSIDPVPKLQAITKDAAEEAELKDAIRRYRQITRPGKLTSDVWDTDEKISLKKTLFTNKVGSRISKLWFESNPPMINISIVNNSIAEQTGKSTPELKMMNERFVVIEGTTDVWDNLTWRRTALLTLRASHASEYDIWIKSNYKQMVDKTRVVFDPSGKEIPKNGEPFINTYRGLPLDLTGIDDPNHIRAHAQPVIDLLLHLCSGDTIKDDHGNDTGAPDLSMFNWVIRWLAIPLQQPGTKLDTALIFHGHIQGAGKSLFFDRIMRRIYGEYHIQLGQGQLESQYNDWVDSKQFAVFEEIFSGSDRFSGMGLIKQIITGATVYVNKKFMSGWEQSNYVNTVFLSNDAMPLKLELNDRRHAVCYPKSEVPADLLARVSAGLDDPDNLMLRSFYAYLLRLSLVNDQGVAQDAHTKPPMNQAKLDIIELSLFPHESFVAAWRAGEIEYAPYQSATSEDLLSAYIMWCKKNNLRHNCSLAKLVMHIKHTAKPEERADRLKIASKAVSGKALSKLTSMVQVGDPPPDSPVTLMEWRRVETEKFRSEIKYQVEQDNPNPGARRYGS